MVNMLLEFVYSIIASANINIGVEMVRRQGGRLTMIVRRFVYL